MIMYFLNTEKKLKNGSKNSKYTVKEYEAEMREYVTEIVDDSSNSGSYFFGQNA
jgi:hypothetical protein